ncbi:hypothetical protein ACFO8O_08160 [Hephaestia sp. GCM10023244]|uniref:hypothetical protein n=1 Tax=unclassified Hephaestia TaxID=2631281 RepID=UPI002076E5B0|nr:hypothetical protein [Hephaestia sp. MAHUQ-44]MCM8730931.1 hypothetical protein [Hephaestia sp. MAHUQ-44]
MSAFKRWATVRDGYWFAPKLFGIGATPVTWQGWALTLGFVVLLIAAIRLLPSDTTRIIVAVVLTLTFIVISWRKTDGGWGWHWGLPD